MSRNPQHIDYQTMWNSLVCYLDRQRLIYHKGDCMSISESVEGEKFCISIINKMKYMEMGFSEKFEPELLQWHFVKDELPKSDDIYIVSTFDNPYINDFQIKDFSLSDGFTECALPIQAWAEIPEDSYYLIKCRRF